MMRTTTYWSFFVFTLSSWVSVVLGFFTLDAKTSLELFSQWGYVWIAGSFFLFLVLVLRQLQPSVTQFSKKPKSPKVFWGFLGVLCCTVYCLAVETWGYRIVTDEPIIIATSHAMAREGQVFVPQAGWEVDGEFLIFDYSVDKRPILYPFWVSLLHTLRGFLDNNGSFCNNILCPLFFLLLYVFLLQHVQPFFAVIALLLVAALPLIPTVFNGMGLEPTMLVMLLTTLLLSKSYLAAPTQLRLSTLCLSALLLAQSRYEMALFVPIVGLVILLGWYRARKIVVSPLFLLIPLFFIPQAWQYSIFRFDADPFSFKDAEKFGVFEETQGSFSQKYFFKNLAHSGRFFFSLLPSGHPGSPPSNRLLSLLGLLGAFWAFYCLARAGPSFFKKSAIFQVSSLFGLGVVASFILHMLYVWGRMDLSITYRFSLLFSISAILPCVQAIERLMSFSKKNLFKLKVCIALLSLGLLGYSGLRAYKGVFGNYGFFPTILEFELAFMEKTCDDRALYLTEMPYLALNNKQSALSCASAVSHPELLTQFNKSQSQSPIYAFQVSIQKGDVRYCEVPLLSAGFLLQPLQCQASTGHSSTMRVEVFQVVGFLKKPPAGRDASLHP